MKKQSTKTINFQQYLQQNQPFLQQDSSFKQIRGLQKAKSQTTNSNLASLDTISIPTEASISQQEIAYQNSHILQNLQNSPIDIKQFNQQNLVKLDINQDDSQISNQENSNYSKQLTPKFENGTKHEKNSLLKKNESRNIILSFKHSKKTKEHTSSNIVSFINSLKADFTSQKIKQEHKNLDININANLKTNQNKINSLEQYTSNSLLSNCEIMNGDQTEQRQSQNIYNDSQLIIQKKDSINTSKTILKKSLISSPNQSFQQAKSENKSLKKITFKEKNEVYNFYQETKHRSCSTITFEKQNKNNTFRQSQQNEIFQNFKLDSENNKHLRQLKYSKQKQLKN